MSAITTGRRTRVAAIVPVLDEAGSIGPVVTGLREHGACCVYVVDGGSTDGTASIAARAGARIVVEPRRGYGRACRAGTEAALGATHRHRVLAFLDGDGSCEPADLPVVAGPLLEPEARVDLVLGIRPRRLVEPGALPWHARLGNRVVASLLAARTGRDPGDLPPFKAIRAEALERLRLDANGYAWTVQLVGRALLRRDIEVARRPVRFRRRRTGTSKVSGSWRASLRAGVEMLAAAYRETRRQPVLALIVKAPVQGQVKTRLAASIGEVAAADFWRASLADLGQRLAGVAGRRGYDPLVVVPTPDAIVPVLELVGPAWRAMVQPHPGLAAALREVFAEAERAAAPAAVAVAGDAPTLPDRQIEAALNSLKRGGRAVLGPTLDGGYHLIGLAVPRESPNRVSDQPAASARRFAAMVDAALPQSAMGTPSSMAVARDALRAAGFKLRLLDPWPDVDVVEDLGGLIATIHDGRHAPRTAAWIRRIAAGYPGRAG